MVWDGHSRTYANHERNERQTERQADEAETRGSTLGGGNIPMAPPNLGAISKTS